MYSKGRELHPYEHDRKPGLHQGIPLGNELKQMISASKEMGKVKYFPIVFDLCSDEMLEAVFLIADNKRFRWGEER